MSIDTGQTAAGVFYDEQFPRANEKQPSKQFRDNFKVVKTAVEALQGATATSGSVLTLSSQLKSGTTTGEREFVLSYKASGLTLPLNTAANTEGLVRYSTTSKHLEFHNGTGWVRGLTAASDGSVTLTTLTVTTRLTLSYTPSANTDAATVKYVNDAVTAAISGNGGSFAALQANAVAQQSAINLERTDRQAADTALSDRINVEKGRVDTLVNTANNHGNRITTLESGLVDERAARIAADQLLRTDMDAATAIVQTASNDVAALNLALDQEEAARIAADNALSIRINTINNTTIPGLQSVATDDRNASVARDDALGALIVTERGRITTEIADRQAAISGVIASLGQFSDPIQTYRTNGLPVPNTDITYPYTSNAITGSLWFDTTDGSIKRYARDTQAQTDAWEDVTPAPADPSFYYTDFDGRYAPSSALTSYLDKDTGGTITGPVVISNTTFTLQGSTFELPGSDIKIDASQALLFTKLPNTTGVGDGGFVTFDENNFRYAFLDGGAATGPERDAAIALGTAANEFACLRIGSTNDAAGAVADSMAIEPSAHLYLNPGWVGQSYSEGVGRAPALGSSIFVGDALNWQVEIARDNGNIFTKGSISATGDITGLSDASVKTNVVQIENALDKIDALTGVMYDRIDQDMKHSTGMIAQDVQKVMPEVIEERYDGKLAVAYGNLMGLIVEGIKELRAEINALKAR